MQLSEPVVCSTVRLLSGLHKKLHVDLAEMSGKVKLGPT